MVVCKSRRLRKQTTQSFIFLHNKPEFSTNGITPGIVIEGSSNLTFSGLKGQGEHNRILMEKHYYEDDVKRFESVWNDPRQYSYYRS
jgi:HKD family nuclease